MEMASLDSIDHAIPRAGEGKIVADNSSSDKPTFLDIERQATAATCNCYPAPAPRPSPKTLGSGVSAKLMHEINSYYESYRLILFKISRLLL